MIVAVELAQPAKTSEAVTATSKFCSRTQCDRKNQGLSLTMNLGAPAGMPALRGGFMGRENWRRRLLRSRHPQLRGDWLTGSLSQRERVGVRERAPLGRTRSIMPWNI